MRFILPLILSTTLVLAHENEDGIVFDRYFQGENGFSGHLHADLESRYATEGRDVLNGDSLFSSTIEAAWRMVSFGVWYGESPEQSYNELQLSTSLNWERDDLAWYIAYTHLRFPDDGLDDHEIGVGAAWSGLPWDFVIAMDAYHSFEATGAFIETNLSREFAITESLMMTPSVCFGINEGYVSDGHNGPNHTALKLGAQYRINESFSLTAHASYSYAISRDAVRYAGDELLRDFFHAGIGALFEF
jgi:hypothetical protein